MIKLVGMSVCILLLLSSISMASNNEEKKPVIPDTIVGAEYLAGPHYVWSFTIPEKDDEENAIDRLVTDEVVTPQSADRIKEVADQRTNQ